MTEIYCLDTSALIESWCRLYRPSSFPTFWTRLEEGINSNFIIASQLVLVEIEKKEDGLYDWAKSQPKLFCPLTVEVQKAQSKIVNSYPKLVSEIKNRSMCDPWVIALAQISNATVVTQEYQGGINKPRIPDVCSQLNVPYMRVEDLIEKLKWKF